MEEARLPFQVAYWREGAGTWGKVQRFATKREAAGFVASLMSPYQFSSSGKELPPPVLVRFEFYGLETQPEAKPVRIPEGLGGHGRQILELLQDGATVKEWREAAFAAGVPQRAWHRWLHALPDRDLVDISLSKVVTLTDVGRQTLGNFERCTPDLLRRHPTICSDQPFGDWRRRVVGQRDDGTCDYHEHCVDGYEVQPSDA